MAKKFDVSQEYAQLIYDQTSPRLNTATDLRVCLLEKGDVIVYTPTQVCYCFALCMALTVNNNFLTVGYSVETLAATEKCPKHHLFACPE